MTRGLGGRPAGGRRQRMRRLRLAAVAGLFAASTGSASADDLRIVDIKAFVFLERADRLSNDLVGAATLVNAPRGGDTATGLMVDLVFQRDKAASEGQKSGPSKNALATVDITQTSLAG